MSYVKLFGSILASTIWREPATTCKLWITMLAMANRDGEVEGSIPGLADMARLTLPECQQALTKLMEPDEFSRTKTDEGRRIKEIRGGWLILNYEFYRDKQCAEDVREKARLRQKRKYDRDKTSREPHVPHAPSPDITTSGSSDLIAAPEEKRAPRAQTSVSRPEDVTEQVWNDFVEFRKSRRARVNETVLSRLRSQASAAGWTMDAALAESVMRGWTGFKAEWVLNRPKNHSRFNEVKHMQNMPLGTAGCLCDECIKFNAKRVAK
jgi:hypothetical protein